MFASMFLFSFAMSITPGPVNTVILSTSLNHGLKRSLPYISGATIGFTLLLIFMAFGLQSVLTQFPVVLKILAVCGTLFVCYIGIKIILSAANISISSAPVGHMLKDGFLLQWLNPKAWLACVSGITMFTSIENPQSLPIFIIIYFFTCYACLFFWGLCGDKFSVVLNQGNRLKYFNILMGAFLILSALLILIDFF
ncbi:LysE family translocator [Acinetobacter baumannii]|uniref:LysE family translocator n=1 Tax=Acinetobacter baumannii TaxID=470 RepID=UPI0002BA7D54|nr:LysE family translocator [Acinetobacter baumannii]EHZ7971550.1 LysE family translocator [Acinetobacter baumannii]EIO2224928.1 LysE family translocator [Acinetobacter baumannii]EJD6087986.1 LysE family translocator [Acinetobacter baumannii]EJN6994360.1 LysE family translocator [Acinetobacter baumannii]EKT9094657.1 LysE family translocator [Acinetobacter baumannii]